MKTYFRPEFINRIDEMVVFHALDEAHRRIAKIQLQYLEKRLAGWKWAWSFRRGARRSPRPASTRCGAARKAAPP